MVPEEVRALEEVLRETAEPVREVDVPLVRTAEEPLRDAPAAEERETLVRPVEDRRTVLPLPETVLAPLREARVTALPPRETRLRELRLPSRPPTCRAWLLRWIQRSLQPPIP